jgi:hypothetical protein
VIDDPEYLAYLDAIPPEVRERIESKLVRMSTGRETAGAIICMGPDKCPFFEYCPIPQRIAGRRETGPLSSYPIGQECVMEKLYILKRVRDLMNALEVSEDNAIEVPIVQELALIDLYKNRAEIFLAKGDRYEEGIDFMKVDLGIFDENGNQTRNTKLHPLVEMMEKLEKRRERWLDRLMATRASKAKIHQVSELSDLIKQIGNIRDALSASVEEAIEVDV